MTNSEIAALIFSVFVVGCLMGGGVTLMVVQEQAIEHGYAEYNSQTGNWQWKELNHECK